MDWKTFTKILRLHRPASAASTTTDSSSTPSLHKLKLSQNLQTLFSQTLDQEPNNQQPPLECLIADLFATISAIKAAYAQLQLAQSPFDPDSIQSSDQSIVSQFKHISELKRSYFKNQIWPPPTPSQPLAARIQEQKNLIKTYQITTKKLESELQIRELDLIHLQSKLAEIENKERKLLHPLNSVHLSGLNPSHFITALRFAVKSIRSFVKIMMREMDRAGWDLDAAAASIQVILKPEHRIFAFQSFVCNRMFSDFHHKDFNCKFLEARSKWDQTQFFEESKKDFDREDEFGKFCRAKYLNLVHPKMAAAFFGSNSGCVLSGSEFSNGFVQMARRIYLLHCLFFSFGSEFNGSIFQVRRGSRFSEVFMDSVADEDLNLIGGVPTVGFTVVPGFRLLSTVIQCKVYLS